MLVPDWPSLIHTRLFYGRDRAVKIGELAEAMTVSRRTVEKANRCPDSFRTTEALAVHRTSHPPQDRGKPVGTRSATSVAAMGGTVIA